MPNEATSSGTERDQEIRQSLAKVLGSAAFAHVDRLKRFLAFIVDESVCGRADKLKEFLIGIEVFGKDSSFDPRTDPIVRVQARRLRARLAKYYLDEGRNDALMIDLPKGSYAPAFHRPPAATPKLTVGAVLTSHNTIAVLPFADRSPQSDQEYFCKGIGDEVVSALTKVESLRVAAWPAVVPEGTDLKEMAERLNAGTVISGSVRRSGEMLRITVQFIDTATGCYIWSENLDFKMKNVFAIQSEVARTVTEKLRTEMAGLNSVQRSRRVTENLAAYNLYLQGRYHSAQRTERGLRKAVELFEKAIAEDPQYSTAYSGLADAYTLLAHYGTVSGAEVWTKSSSNAAWAVMLDEDSAEGHTSLAHINATQGWDWHGSEREFQRAITLNPRYATAHHWYAMTGLAPLSRLDEALKEMALAQALDPVSSIISRDVAMVYYFRREFDLALEQCDRTIEQNPQFSGTYATLGAVQACRMELEESVAAYQRAIQLSPQSPGPRGGLGRTLALWGKKDEALAMLAELDDLAQKRYVSPFDYASIYLGLGDSAKGFEWIEKARQDRTFELIFLRVDPRFDPFREDPRFIALTNQMGLA